jgi:flagellar motor protein MotB
MRALSKRAHHDEEEESAFISMTDMTVGFLFIMMILLAFFVSRVRDAEVVPLADFDAVVSERDSLVKKLDKSRLEVITLNIRIKELEAKISNLLAVVEEKDREIKKLQSELDQLKQVDPLEAYLAKVAQVRRDVLKSLRDVIRLDFPDLKVELSEQSDALRFQGEGLFASGRANLSPQKELIVQRLSLRLDEVLPCFTVGPVSAFSDDCNPGFVMIEAVQIEGHTDNVGSDFINRTLSTGRANNTFFSMTEAAPRVMEHLNLKQQPVLSVAAYGADRPVATNDNASGRATNRRIDLRFIMVTPQDTDGIATIRAALRALSEIE